LARVFAPVIVLSVLLGGCASSPWTGAAPAFDPLTVLQTQQQVANGTAEQAREALQAVREARVRLGADLVREKIGCYQRILVSACLERVADRERKLDDRLDGIEVRANQRLRDLASIERSEREAKSIEERRTQATERRANEARNRERYEERQKQGEEAQAERKAQAPELARREQAQRERQLERERAFEQRQKSAPVTPRAR